jgi:hypothetical protein
LLRTLVLALLLANLAFYAWVQGWFGAAAPPPMSSQREPGRLAEQLRPESITVLAPKAVAQARQADAARQTAAAAQATQAGSSAASAASGAAPRAP